MNRRKVLRYLGISPAFLAGFPASTEKARVRVASSDENAGGPITVMNPAIANRLAERVPLVPPLDDLNDKLIYMINLSWEGPDAANYFYGAMTEWLQQHYSGVKTVVKVTAEGMFGTDPLIMKEITANKADAVIVGVAG
jgi:hypothetical protein